MTYIIPIQEAELRVRESYNDAGQPVLSHEPLTNDVMRMFGLDKPSPFVNLDIASMFKPGSPAGP